VTFRIWKQQTCLKSSVLSLKLESWFQNDYKKIGLIVVSWFLVWYGRLLFTSRPVCGNVFISGSYCGHVGMGDE
jgi:hypothetical protein